MRHCTYLIQTLGCKVNQYESQALAEALDTMGFSPAARGTAPAVIILNTCAVTSESVRKAKQMLRRSQSRYPDAYVFVTGCAAQLDSGTFASIPGVTYICGTRNKTSILSQIKNLMTSTPIDQPIRIIPPCGEIEPMSITHFERTRAYVKIQDGCNGRCSYCIIPTLRGDVCSRNRESIIKEASALAQNGICEIVLTGIETSAYEYDLASLIENIHEIEGITRIRLGSLDPSFMKKEFADRIASLPKVAPHFHLSMQSGSNTVLARMRRRYRIQTALENIAYLREKMPSVQFSTDIIVGFPGETENEFDETLTAIGQIGLLHIHVFPFSPRPGTPAAKMPFQIAENVKTERAKRLAALGEQQRDHILADILKTAVPLAIITERIENGYARGHSAQFIEVRFRAEQGSVKRGDLVWIRPLSIEGETLLGEIIHQTIETKEITT